MSSMSNVPSLIRLCCMRPATGLKPASARTAVSSGAPAAIALAIAARALRRLCRPGTGSARSAVPTGVTTLQRVVSTSAMICSAYTSSPGCRPKRSTRRGAASASQIAE
ncbi:hypothetical protein D3C72_1615070 [compost metagenome]